MPFPPTGIALLFFPTHGDWKCARGDSAQPSVVWNDESTDASVLRFMKQLEMIIDDDTTDIFISARSGVWKRTCHGHSEQVQRAIPEDLARAVAVKLIGRGGRHIDDARPAVDVALNDGVRVHAILGGVSVGGTEVSIRLPSREVMNLDDMLAVNAAPELAPFLRDAVARARTLLVTGRAGAGKTSLLAALLAVVPPAERIIVVEDVSELRIQHDRVISLETRPANSEGRGEIGVTELIRQTLRMRPDRLVLGECRGAEVLDMLMAFNTGHTGGGSTMHANSLRDVPSRIVALCALAGRSESETALLARSAIDLVIHIDVASEQRRLSVGRLVVKKEEAGLRLDVEEISFGATSARHGDA